MNLCLFSFFLAVGLDGYGESVLRNGKGNDLDLIAVPMELSVTPPEEMERIMCERLDAKALPEEPKLGLLGSWTRPCILRDGRQIDMEYRFPLPADLRNANIAPILTLFGHNGYQVAVSSFPNHVSKNFLELFAMPIRPDVTSPQDMDRLIPEKFRARLNGEPTEKSTWRSTYVWPEGWSIGVHYLVLSRAE